MKIGKRLQLLREMRGFTQEGIAQELGISQSAYSKIESNYTSISIEKMMKLSIVLKFPLEKILDFDFENYIESPFSVKEPSISITETLTELYERKIHHLKEEVLFLRDELKSKRKHESI